MQFFSLNQHALLPYEYCSLHSNVRFLNRQYMFQQAIGILMCANCAQLLSDLLPHAPKLATTNQNFEVFFLNIYSTDLLLKVFFLLNVFFSALLILRLVFQCDNLSLYHIRKKHCSLMLQLWWSFNRLDHSFEEARTARPSWEPAFTSGLWWGSSCSSV